MDNNKIVSSLQFAEEMHKVGQEFVDKLAMCYGMLGEAYLGSAGKGAITQNKEVYRYLFNPMVISYSTYMYMCGNMDKHKQTYPKLDAVLNPQSKTYITYIVKGLPDVKPIETISSVSEIIESIQTFGITKASDADKDEVGEVDKEAESKLAGTGLFDDSSLDEELARMLEDPMDDLESYGDGANPVGIGGDDTEKDNQEPQTPQEPQEQQKPKDKSDTAQNVDNDTDDDNEDFSDLRKVWGEQLSPTISGIMAAFKDLYSSGYGLINPSGILTNAGIACSKSNQKSVFRAGNPVTDIKLYNKICEVTGNQFTQFTQHDDDFDIITAMQTNQPVTLSDFHIRNIFGHFSFCTGKYSIRKYITSHKINNGSTVKMIKYSDMSGYIRECVEKIFYRSYRKVGITTEVTAGSMELVDRVNSTVSRCLKNVIIVSERKPNVNTHLKICCDTPLDINGLMRALQDGLNVGTSRSVLVKEVTPPKNGVYDINIVYNDKAYSQDALFAYQVTDILMEQGIKPSWDNVIMGKSLDGNIMTYNFKTDQQTTFAIYAGSRSGKGVMTLSLLASAMADNCKIMYTDGKPEMAQVLGGMTWKNGLDTYAFNGVELNAGSVLEGPGCLRQVDRFYDLGNIPDTILTSEYKRTQFALTCHYYRSLGLIAAMASARANNVAMDDWIVAVFDECEQFAAQDQLVEEWLEEDYNLRKKVPGPDGKKINVLTDPGCKFIDEYRAWKRDISTLCIKGIKSAFGKAHMSIFFIWQSSKFPGIYQSKSTLAEVIEKSAGRIVKILGKGAIEKGGSDNFGNNGTLKEMPWYDDKFRGETGGYFAIGTDIKKVKVFRPFNVYTDANHPEQIIMNAKASGMSEQDLIGVSLNEDGSVIPEVGFEGYVTKLLTPYGISPSQELNSGYSYADAFVRDSGLAESLLHYMYNVSDFTLLGSKTSGASEDDRSYNFGDLDDGDEIDAGSNHRSVDQTKFIFSDEQIEEDPTPTEPIQYEPETGGYRNLTGDDRAILEAARRYEAEQQAKRAQQAQWQQAGSPAQVYEPPVEGYQGPQSGEISDDDLYNGGNHERVVYRGNVVNPSPEEVRNGGNRTFSKGKGADFGVTFFTSDRVSKIFNLTPENSFIVTVSDHRPIGKSNKLMRTFRGAQYEFTSRWDSVLRAVGRSQDLNTITHAIIFNDALVFNKRQVAMVGIVGGDDGVEVRDIVSFTKLAKKCRNIRSLKIDNDIYDAAILELGNYPEATFFNIFPSLTNLSIWAPGCVERPRTYTRKSINSEAAHQEMQIENTRARLKRGIDTIAAANDPSFASSSAVNQTRILNKAKSFSGSGWESCKSNFKNNNFVRGSLAGAFAIAAGTIGLGLSGVFKLSNLFRRK